MYQVDAFTPRLFRGNPAAVVVLDDWLPGDVLQAIAAESNLSETTFERSRRRVAIKKRPSILQRDLR